MQTEALQFSMGGIFNGGRYRHSVIPGTGTTYPLMIPIGHDNRILYKCLISTVFRRAKLHTRHYEDYKKKLTEFIQRCFHYRVKICWILFLKL